MKRSLDIFSPQQKSTIINPNSKQSFVLLNESFATLSDDPKDPLSCISVSNSSLSIDLWKGCRWQCAYCHVQGSIRNLNEEGFMPNKATLHRDFTEREVVDALLATPLFVKNETIISIGTASTEPFAVGEVLNSTFNIVDELIRRSINNPVWIVTKAGVPNQALPRISQVTPHIKSLIISPTFGALNKEIEPVQNNRFFNIEQAYSLGAKIVLYLRPLVKSWGTTVQKVRIAMESATNDISNKTVSAVVIGGLRWTEGIEYGLQNRDINWPEELQKVDNYKDLPDDLFEEVSSLCNDLLPSVPVVKHSSCALAHVLKHSDALATFAYGKDDCKESTCSQKQRESCMKAAEKLLDENLVEIISKQVKKLTLPIIINSINESGKLNTSPEFIHLPYAIQTTLRKIVGKVLLKKYE